MARYQLCVAINIIFRLTKTKTKSIPVNKTPTVTQVPKTQCVYSNKLDQHFDV